MCLLKCVISHQLQHVAIVHKTNISSVAMSEVVARRCLHTSLVANAGFYLGRCGSITRHGTAWCPSSASPTTPSWEEICPREGTPASSASPCPTIPSTSQRSSSPMPPCESEQHMRPLKLCKIQTNQWITARKPVMLHLFHNIALACWRRWFLVFLTVCDQMQTGELGMLRASDW